MRAVLGAVVIAVVLALPASAASLDPKGLVLHQIDVPTGYLLDESQSLVLPGDFARSGRLTGYYALYRNTSPPYWRTIVSVSHVFRRPEGARTFLRMLDREARRESTGSLERRSVDIGAQGWIYTVRAPDRITVVVWRHGRVVAQVNCSCSKTSGKQALALALARKQQRRIAAALR